MCSQSQGIGSADISALTYDKIRNIPARLHCASHRRDNAKSVSQRIWQMFHNMKPNAGTVSRTLPSQALDLQEIVRPCQRYNAVVSWDDHRGIDKQRRVV
jgi:hypothetical protein